VPTKKVKQPLSVTHPELAKEADGWDPTHFSKGSADKLRWKCKVGHRWEARVSNRAIKGYGCPICSGQQILPGFNDLKTLFPKVAAEAAGWDPSEVAPFSNRKLPWKCQLGHCWLSTVGNRTLRNDGCSVCSNHKTLAGYNDVATTDPDLALEANGWDPATLTRSSNKVVLWKCKLGHAWKTKPATRVLGVGCPICGGKVVLVGFNDLETLLPEIALQAYGWDPKSFTKGSQTRKKWRCNLGHIWTASISSRSRGSGCPICSGQQVLVGFNDLKTNFPEIASEAFGWDPTTVTVGSTKKTLNTWKCKLGHVWKTSIAKRTAGSGCPFCEGQKAWPGFNDLATTHPDLASEAYGWDPSMVMAGSDKVLSWKCSVGHIWRVRVANRKKGGKCPICLGQRVLIGYNDIATTHPEIATEAYEWDPLTLTAGSGLRRKFKCAEGHIWETVVGHRTGSNPTGCPSCSETGFSPIKDGYLYFMYHPDWEMYQIGITNVPDDRIGRHKRLSWIVLEVRGPMDGYLTQQWETAILRMLKAKGADLSNEKIAGKFDGYSEAWSKSTFEVSSIKELMRLTEEFEEKESLFNNNQMT
jgi:hypothetical protein